MAGNNERCKTYLACPRTTGEPQFDGEFSLSLLEVPCISTENVSITQNKTQLAACRDDSSAVDNIDGTSYSATGQIELKDAISKVFAELLYTKACECIPVCFLFLTPKIPNAAMPDPDNYLNPDNTEVIDGLVVCGVPDASWTRDQGGKSLSYTITPTDPSFGAGKYRDWLNLVTTNNIFLIGDTVSNIDDVIDLIP